MTTNDGKTPSGVLAEALADVRGRQGLSAEALAQRVREHGGQLDRAAISKIENGIRGVSLDEALLLAVALGVSPLHLMLPREDDDVVELAPDIRVEAVAARRWVRGTEPLHGQDDRVFRTEVPASEWAAANARLARAEDRVRETHTKRRIAEAMAERITAELAVLDQKAPAMSNPFKPEPEVKQIRRLEKRLDVAYDRIAEATVEADDAVRELHAIRREMQAVGGND